jgi:hypothetical protein
MDILCMKKNGKLILNKKRNISDISLSYLHNYLQLDKDSTVRKFRTVRKEENRNVSRDLEYYNLDMIISVGYRVKSKTATQFRQWATKCT